LLFSVNSVDIDNGQMTNVVACGKFIRRWMLIACVLLPTSVMIVISFFRTPTQLDIVVTTGQRVVLSNGTVFRGRLITSSDQLNNSAINSTLCVKASTGGMTFPICVYEAKQDIWVSATFIRGGYWERSIVDRFIRLLRRNPDVEFVDL